MEKGPDLKDMRKMLLAGQVHPDLQSWLARNAQPMRLLEEASGRTRFYLPILSIETSTPVMNIAVPSVALLRQAAYALGNLAKRKYDLSSAIPQLRRNLMRMLWLRRRTCSQSRPCPGQDLSDVLFAVCELS
jgi:hypothetical protein